MDDGDELVAEVEAFLRLMRACQQLASAAENIRVAVIALRRARLALQRLNDQSQ